MEVARQCFCSSWPCNYWLINVIIVLVRVVLNTWWFGIPPWCVSYCAFSTIPRQWKMVMVTDERASNTGKLYIPAFILEAIRMKSCNNKSQPAMCREIQSARAFKSKWTLNFVFVLIAVRYSSLMIISKQHLLIVLRDRKTIFNLLAYNSLPILAFVHMFVINRVESALRVKYSWEPEYAGRLLCRVYVLVRMLFCAVPCLTNS